MEEKHKNWSNNSDNTNNGIDKIKDKVIDKEHNTIEDGACKKKDKGGLDVRVNKYIAIKQDKDVQGIEKDKGS